MNHRPLLLRGLGHALVASTAASGWVGCGNAPAPPATSPAPQAVASAAPADADIAPDLSEVPEPAQLVALVRWKSPQATLDTVSQWMGLHLSATELAAEAIERSIAETIRFDAPVDAAVALDPDAEARGGVPFFAVAVGARSLEDARRAVGIATEVAPGQYRVRLGHGKRKAELPFCMLSASPGAAPARFVCGRRERDVDALYPYLTRTAPRHDLGSADVHAELRAVPFFSAYGSLIDQGLRMGATLVPRRLEVGEPAFDRALGRITLAITEELGAVAADLDTISLDVAVQPERAKADLAIAFRNRQSWTAALLASEEAKAGAPPAMFYRLPRAASSASYTFSPEARRLEAIRHSLGELLDGWLLHEGLDMADRAAIAELFSDKYSTDSALVSASGSFAEAPAPAPSKGRSKTGPRSGGDESGWYLIGVDAPNQTVDFVKTLAAALNRPKLQAYVKSKLADLNGKAGFKTAPLTMKSVPAPRELPKGSLDYEISISREAWLGLSQQKPQQRQGDAGAAPPSTIKLHLVVVPERAGQTWILLGEGRPELFALARATAEGDKENETLAQRPELAGLKDDKLIGAGFITFEAFLKPWLLPLSSERAPRERRTMLQATPNKGKTPMLFRSKVSARDSLVLTTDFAVPRGAIEDLVIFATTSSLLGATSP